MTTTRRGFFGSVAAAFGAMALDPERALWIPGQKLISIPKPQLFQPMAATQIINAAFCELGLLLPGETLSKADTEHALFRLNAMVDSWTIPARAISREYVDSAIYGLAFRLSPMYGLDPNRVLFRMIRARDWL